MSNLTESNSFDANVYEIATTDSVIGGPGGISNLQAQSLANRTNWLKLRYERGLKFASMVKSVINTPTATTLSDTDIGKSYSHTLLDDITYTLPDLATANINAGEMFKFEAQISPGSGKITVNPAAGNFFYGSVSTYVLQPGDILLIAKLDAGYWSVVSLYRHDKLAVTGEVKYVAFNSTPTGYLACDGAAVSRTTYSGLFAAISTTFGVGDGSTTFNVPDLRGEFIRGIDNGRGVDSGRVFGSAQADLFKAHVHDSGNSGSISGGTSHATYQVTGGSNVTAADATGSTGGTETRPRNIALLPIIKY